MIPWSKMIPGWLWAVGAAVVAVVLFLVGRSLGKLFKSADPIGAAGRAHDAGVDVALDRIDARDAEAAAAIDAEREGRDNLRAEGREAATRREEDHASLDDADSIDDVDAVVYGDKRD